MTTIVTAIRGHGRGSRQRAVYVDDELWRPMPEELVTALGLEVGQPVDVASREAFLADAEARLARERAFRLLRYRERSSAEVCERLLDDGYSAVVAETTVADLTASGLVDDERFGQAAARTLATARGLGRQRLVRELERRGLAHDHALTLADEYVPEADERDRALHSARSLRRPRDTVEKLAARLVRRGFTVGASLEAARSVLGEAEGRAFD